MSKQVNVKVDAGVSMGVQEHLWRYIGYDECNYTYIPEGVELLKKFAALEDAPYYFRTHFMFCTGNCHGTYKFGSTNIYWENGNGEPVYDFTYYDYIIDAFLSTGNKPFIELGFMPMDLVDTNYLRPAAGNWEKYGRYKEVGWTCPPKDYDKWHDFIKAVASHLVEKYGAEEVKSWYFELWNEPDIFYWSGTAAEYCKLYDYTEHAVHEVLPELRLSGPAVTGIFEGGHAQKFFRFFLNHCRDGANFCTQEKGTRLDFITFHVKGGGFPFEMHAPKAVPSVESLVHQVKLGLDIIQEYGYQDCEVVLSEADPDGWAAGGIYDNANMIFRNTEYYATYVASTYEKIDQLSSQYGLSLIHISLLVMGYTGEKAMRFKLAYIKQFNAMEKALQGKLIEREKGIAVRQSLTKALQQSAENDRMHGHAYSTYTNCIYKVLFGKNAKQLRENLGIGPKDNLRDYLSAEELRAVQSMECLVSGLVDCGWGYDQIKEFIQQNNTMLQVAA